MIHYYMNLANIQFIPSELRNHINGYVPYQKCYICSCEMIDFSSGDGPFICSITCLHKFDKEIVKRIKYNQAIYFTHKVATISNYTMGVSYIVITVVTAFFFPISILLFFIYHITRLFLAFVVKIML